VILGHVLKWLVFYYSARGLVPTMVCDAIARPSASHARAGTHDRPGYIKLAIIVGLRVHPKRGISVPSLNLKSCAGNPSQRDHLLLCLPLAEGCAITKSPIGKQTCRSSKSPKSGIAGALRHPSWEVSYSMTCLAELR
jgi:hypothetical protein